MPHWFHTPFAYRFLHFNIHAQETSLPFAIGGATQQGTQHAADNQNNQDACYIVVTDKFIVGILCDGCSSTHDELSDEFSNNEVGAKLIALMAGNAARDLLDNGECENPDAFLKALSERALGRLSQVVELCAGPDLRSQQIFVQDFLMTTVLGIVITPARVTIFHCGDGVISMNGQISLIEDSGSYFLAEALLQRFFPGSGTLKENGDYLKIIHHGSTEELQTLFLATDGFRERVGDDHLLNFITEPPTHVTGGFDLLLPMFRQQVLSKRSEQDIWPMDDASFLVVKRTCKPGHKEQQEDITPNPEDSSNDIPNI
jgi:serine/threonine protein phosphatase PrpC